MMRIYIKSRFPKFCLFRKRRDFYYYQGALGAIESLMEAKVEHEGPEDEITWDMLYRFRNENVEALEEAKAALK